MVPGNQIVGKGNSLGVHAEGYALGQKQIIGDKNRAVLHLKEDVSPVASELSCMADFARHLRARHPVKPDAVAVAAINMVMADGDINRAMKLDAGLLVTRKTTAVHGCRESHCR